jgi:hypothetical protein
MGRGRIHDDQGWLDRLERDAAQVHYGCHEFRDDSERMIQGRGHPALDRLYHAHLAFCVDCQRYHHQLEAIYRKPRKVSPLDSFARDHEFAAIRARVRESEARRSKTRMLGSAGVGLLSIAAAILALALIVPSFGAQLFGPPRAAALDLRPETGFTSYGDGVHIPVRRLGHQAQSFARVIGGNAVLTDADGRPLTGDSLTVGTMVATGDEPVQVAFVGRLIGNFQPQTVARWHSASPSLIEIGLAAGTLAIRYDRSPGDPLLQVRTPSALIRVVGTVFTVAVDERGHTTVAVLRGRVEVVDPRSGRALAEIEAGFRFDSRDGRYRELGRREVAAALPLSEQGELRVSISPDGELVFDEPTREPGQIPGAWTVPGLSGDPAERTLDRVPNPDAASAPAEPRRARVVSPPVNRAPSERRPLGADEAATRKLITSLAHAERERTLAVERQLERCRELQAEPETRFRAARCLGDFMRDYGDRPEAVEGLLMLGTLRMDFAHDYQSATRNFEEFLRRAPGHSKAELARYKLVLAEIEAGYIDRAIQRARVYLHHYPDGQYVGRILQRFPELKSAI